MSGDGPISFAAYASIKASRTSGSSPSLEVKNHSRACSHRDGRIEIDAGARTVFCSVCGAQIDPFDALVAIADSERGLEQRAKMIQKDIELQRGFYAAKKTVTALRCRHTRAYKIGDGKMKCLRCDTVFTMPDGATKGGEA